MALRNFYILRFMQFLRDRFDLMKEKEDEIETMEAIRRGVIFKGTNLWVLIFAIFVASLGLNTNSTAVIIGAMLISPLMGPIMGVGLGLGINDLELIKRSLKNIAIATLFSILTAALYFFISPLDEARSELLARTQPTIYDVLIAFFGGMAGIVASSSREKGNVIPGVAIATALMPPLCTAGFGLATAQWSFFFGAFYLYLINSVFISLATFLGVRIMKFPHKVFMDKEREKKVGRWITFFVILTIAPSIWISMRMVKESYLSSRASAFISNELTFEGSQIISKEINVADMPMQIKVAYIGKQVEEKLIDLARTKMPNYSLEDAVLSVSQGSTNMDIQSLRSMVVEDFYKRSEEEIRQKNEEVESLNLRLAGYERLNALSPEVAAEAKVLFPLVKTIGLSNLITWKTDSIISDTTVVAVLALERPIGTIERTKMAEWLKQRVNASSVRLITQ